MPHYCHLRCWIDGRIERGREGERGFDIYTPSFVGSGAHAFVSLRVCSFVCLLVSLLVVSLLVYLARLSILLDLTSSIFTYFM